MTRAAPAMKGGRGLFRRFTVSAWDRLREGLAFPLGEEELARLRGRGETISVKEAQEVYMPLCRLLHHYIVSLQDLHVRTDSFLGRGSRAPFVVAVVGSVAVGKSTTGRILRELLSRWLEHPDVELASTDGFLYPNAKLEVEGLMEKKGWPESYDARLLGRFLRDVKSSRPRATAPVYSHESYDVLEGERRVFARPDVLVVEGLNLLQGGYLKDFIDFAIYLDAEEEALESWYVERFMELRRTAFRDPAAYFHKYASLSKEESREEALRIWRTVNLENLRRFIAPTRERASLILRKGVDHRITEVFLRRL